MSSPTPTTVGSIQIEKYDGDGHADRQTDRSANKVTCRAFNLKCRAQPVCAGHRKLPVYETGGHASKKL